MGIVQVQVDIHMIPVPVRYLYCAGIVQMASEKYVSTRIPVGLQIYIHTYGINTE